MNKNTIWQGNKEKHTSKNPLLRYILKRFNNDLTKIIKKISPKEILDIGCGEGFTTKAIAKELPNTKFKAIDIEKEYIECAKKNKPTNVDFEIKDLFTMNNEEKYDLVMSNEVLEHLTEYNKMINIIESLSNKYMLLSVPNEPYFRLANILRLKYLKSFGNPKEHINNWTKNQFKEICKKYGKIVEFKTSTFWNICLISKHLK